LLLYVHAINKLISQFYHEPFCFKKSFTSGIQFPYELNSKLRSRGQDELLSIHAENALERIHANRELNQLLVKDFHDTPLRDLSPFTGPLINDISHLTFDGNTEYIIHQRSKYFNKSQEFEKHIPHEFLEHSIRQTELDTDSSPYIGNQLCVFDNEYIIHPSGPIMNILHTLSLGSMRAPQPIEFTFPILQIAISHELLAVRLMYHVTIIRYEKQEWMVADEIQFESRTVGMSWSNGERGVQMLCVITEDGIGHIWRSTGEKSTFNLLDAPIRATNLTRIAFGAHPQTLNCAHFDSVTLIDTRVRKFYKFITFYRIDHDERSLLRELELLHFRLILIIHFIIP
jgi:hypothetical protein